MGPGSITVSSKAGATMGYSVLWAVAVAGLYALACQVKPDITPDVFWRQALNTSDTISNDNGKLGKIVNPVKLIKKFQ